MFHFSTLFCISSLLPTLSTKAGILQMLPVSVCLCICLIIHITHPIFLNLCFKIGSHLHDIFTSQEEEELTWLQTQKNWDLASQWPSAVSTGLPPPGPGVQLPKQSLEFFRFVNLCVCFLNMINYPQTAWEGTPSPTEMRRFPLGLPSFLLPQDGEIFMGFGLLDPMGDQYYWTGYPV